MRPISSLRSDLVHDERGVSAVIVAIIVVVLFGFTALGVDVARLYEERRELQRTADVAALSGAQVLTATKAGAVATSQYYVTENPSVHHRFYDEETDDVVAQRIVEGDPGCDINGQNYDCVEVTVRARSFDFLFARVLGFDGMYFADGPDEAVGARATAVVGAGAPGGEKLVPWVVVDCPNAAYDGLAGDTATYATIEAKVAATYPGRCPYEFSTSGWAGPRNDLFLDTTGATGGNFQGADMAAEPCPPPATSDGLFPKSGGAGGADYSDFLAGENSPTVIPCTIAKGARIYPKTGVMVGPTKSGLDSRGVDTCLNEASFNSTLQDPDGDGVYQILDHHNPCLLAIVFAVHGDPSESALESDVPGAGLIPTLQHPDSIDADGDNVWRFARPANGASKPMLVRRFGFFYLTELGGSKAPYRGLFIRALDSANSRLGGTPCNEFDGICVVKLTLPSGP